MKRRRGVVRAAGALFRLLWEGRPGSAAGYPELADRLPGSRVLCLAPHPDDETLGCGGTLRKHVLAGDQTAVAFLNDGGRGVAEATSAPAQRACAERRKREARAALKVLGVGSATFFGLPDGRLRGNVAEAGQRLAALLKAFRPDVVCFPHPFDNHPDHTVVFDVVARAAQAARTSFRAAAYEVWTPLAANTLVDITQQMAVKETALRKYASQIAALDYVERVRGLNAYRSLSWPKQSRYAEAFYVSPWPEFSALIRRVRRGR